MKRVKDILIGVLIGCMLMATPVLADTVLTKIDVVLNGVNVQLEGADVQVESILYNGTTYLPMRKVAELVGKDIDWKQETKTANIITKTAEKVELEGGESVNSETEANASGYKAIQEDDIDVTIAEIDGKEYYRATYILKLMSTEHENITWTYNSPKISIYKTLENGDKEALIDSVQYETYDGRAFISKSYYETTILPLIEK